MKTGPEGAGSMMGQAVSDLAVLVRTIQPVLHEGVYVYSVVPHGTDLSSVSMNAIDLGW